MKQDRQNIISISIAGQFGSSYKTGTDKILFLLQVSLDPPINRDRQDIISISYTYSDNPSSIVISSSWLNSKIKK
jgi:hypothetical protein